MYFVSPIRAHRLREEGSIDGKSYNVSDNVWASTNGAPLSTSVVLVLVGVL